MRGPQHMCKGRQGLTRPQEALQNIPFFVKRLPGFRVSRKNGSRSSVNDRLMARALSSGTRESDFCVRMLAMRYIVCVLHLALLLILRDISVFSHYI